MTKMAQIVAIKHLGLTDHEAAVYVTSLSLGPSSVLEIARKTDMHRTTVYAVIEALKAKGLMHEEARGFKKKFAAENPEKLESTLDRMRGAFRESLPELMALYNAHGGESAIKYYEGLKAVENVYDEILAELKPREEWLAISDTQLWYDLDPAYFDALLEKRAKKQLDVRLILKDSAKAREFRMFAKNFSMRVKIVPEDQAFKMSLLVTPRHLLLHALTDATSAIFIKNQRAVEMQRQVFNLMWEALPNA